MTENQENQAAEYFRLPLIGDKAPSFTADSTQGPIQFPENFKGKWVILFSHPSDFTPVCTSEFMTFARMAPEFEKLNTQLVGISVDSVSSHIAWLRKIQEDLAYKDIRNQAVSFPLIADLKMDVSKRYGMLQPGASDTKTVRAVFFIDPQSIIRAIIYYPMSNGRNMQEIKRLLIAMQTSDAYGVATPADWQPGEDVLMSAPGTLKDAHTRLEQSGKEGYRCEDWFFCFKPVPKK